VEIRPSNFDVGLLLAERAARVDGVVLEAAESLLFPTEASRRGLALAAVGGYGRRQLFPYSDLDLLLLCETERETVERKAPIAEFLRKLWDCGLRVSQSVRTPAECLEVHDQNIELNISLLDLRWLAGDRALYGGLEEKMPRFLQANRDALVRNLSRLTGERHAKFAGTLYHLEPAIKEAPGGLRDYQLLCWLEQLRGAAAAPPPELQRAFEHLARIRWRLHEMGGRDQNTLTFDAQDVLAEEWGQGDAARYMREYYRHSVAIYRAAGREMESLEGRTSGLLAQFRDWRSRLGNADIGVRRERAFLREPHMLEDDPELALRLFEFTARHGIRPSLETTRRIEAQAARLRAWFSVPRPIWPALSRIFTLPHAPLALRAMHEAGVLGAIFPELDAIECLVIRDFYHRYTVDEHSMVALEKLWRPDAPFADLVSELTEPGALVFAALFHDSGKGSSGGHVDGSLRLAKVAMDRVAPPPDERETVLFLIRNHLELSATMRGRDVFDPRTIREAAERAQTVERLKALTLLTYADISAVNPGAMTPWRAEQLWQLYMAVYNELTRELEGDRIPSLPAGSSERAEFLEGFPTRYLRTHTETEIDEHMALEARSRRRGVAVDVRRLEAAWRMTLAASDRPGLFAAAAGTLSGFGLNILRAEAFGNRRGVVLDTFTFADPLRNLELNPSEVDRLRATAERVIAGRTDVKELLRSRPKPALPSRKARIPAKIHFDPDASGAATLIEIVAEDRPGLLYDLASAISSNGGSIEVVLIDTEAHRAIDVFYVTAEGRKLTPEKRAAIGEALQRAVG
jgi:[protein-PII] uridylyltransferase